MPVDDPQALHAELEELLRGRHVSQPLVDDRGSSATERS
jgi:hypothetical protein